MASVTLSATPSSNGYLATVSYDGWVEINSAETYPTIAEAITAAAIKMPGVPKRLEAMDREAQTA